MIKSLFDTVELAYGRLTVNRLEMAEDETGETKATIESDILFVLWELSADCTITTSQEVWRLAFGDLTGFHQQCGSGQLCHLFPQKFVNSSTSAPNLVN